MADTFDAEELAREHGLDQERYVSGIEDAFVAALNAAYRRGREDGIKEAAEVVKGKGAYGGGMIHREVTLAKIEAALTTKEPVGMTAAAEVAKLKERIAALEAAIKAATEPRPMETAPKDQRKSILVAKSGTPAVRAYWGGVHWKMHGTGDDLVGQFEPEMWWPLPTPPAGGAHD